MPTRPAFECEPAKRRKRLLQSDTNRPLCVDLDGTLVKSDILWESLFQYLKIRPWSIFLLPVWILRGKAWFKAHIAAGVDPDPALLPYHATFVEYLREQKRAGRELVLSTAANERPAKLIAEQVYDNSMIAAGFVEDPRTMVNRIYDLLGKLG